MAGPNEEKQTEPRKLKILALHGYRQNGNMFKMKTGALRKSISRYAQLTFITAPHRCEGEEESRSWWFNSEERTFSGKCLGGPALGFAESVAAVERACSQHGPFDGVLGFSQGACLAALLASMQRRGLVACSFRFAILISGFVSGSLVHRPFYDDPVPMPSLHVYGESDSIIPKEMSEALMSWWAGGGAGAGASAGAAAGAGAGGEARADVHALEHAGGHYVPSGEAARATYARFLQPLALHVPPAPAAGPALAPPMPPTPPPPSLS